VEPGVGEEQQGSAAGRTYTRSPSPGAAYHPPAGPLCLWAPHTATRLAPEDGGVAAGDEEESAVWCQLEGARGRRDGVDRFTLPARADRDDLTGVPVGDPVPPAVPPRGLGEPESVEEEVGVGHTRTVLNPDA